MLQLDVNVPPSKKNIHRIISAIDHKVAQTIMGPKKEGEARKYHWMKLST